MPAARHADGRRTTPYLLRNVHVTGHVDIHEMAFRRPSAGTSTLFSCLFASTPSTASCRAMPALRVEAMRQDAAQRLRDGRRAVALPDRAGRGNEREGWRANKRTGGVVPDVDSGEVVARGLSMPHSPRLHRGRLWVLESGRGALSTVDTVTGRVEMVAQVPGFTRGLDFVGPVAFIGLSQLRTSNPFTDIPLTDENPERASGVWAVNIETGRTIAFLRFSASVEEIFAVQALSGLLAPTILEDDDALLESCWAIPDALLGEVEER
jgi:uncharacterized protein (TIGR03032 family)